MSRKVHLPEIHIVWVSGVNCAVLIPRKKKIVLAVTIVQVNDIVMFVCCFVYFALSNHNLLLGKWCLYFST